MNDYRRIPLGCGQMDVLTHLFLPLTVAYVLARERVATPLLVVLSGFGVLPDLDKYLGMPGLLHSLITIVLVALALAGLEWVVWRGVTLSTLAFAFLGSHLLLDIIDGGPVPLMYPLVETGLGLHYPIQTTFGSGVLGINFEGAPVHVVTAVPRHGFNTYGFINGFGVASALLFGVIYLGLHGTQGGDWE